MRWLTNGIEVKRARHFTLANTDIKIHHVYGFDNYWFLTYEPLDIQWHELNTQDFNEAKKKAAEYIQYVRRLILDKTEVDKNMLVQAALESDEFVEW